MFLSRLLFWSDVIDSKSHSVIEMALMDGTKRRTIVTQEQDNQLSVLTSKSHISYIYITLKFFGYTQLIFKNSIYILDWLLN